MRQLFHGNAAFVKWHIRNLHVLLLIHARKQRIARCFHGKRAIAAKQLRNQLIQRLRASADDNLLGAYVHAAVFAQVVGDRLAKLGRSCCRRRFGKRCRRLVRQRFAHSLRPGGVGEQLGG